MSETVESQEYQNLVCVISKRTYGDFNVHDIQANDAWTKNPYGNDYAVVPDEMVTAILETGGYCNIILNDEGTEVVSFTAREIPEIPETEPQVTLEDIRELQLTQLEAMAEQYEMNEANRLNDLEVQATIYETLLAIQEGGMM